jgi:ribose transport system permease protein
VVVTILLILALRYTSVGRRFQVVGANPVASNVVGVRVTLNQILVYVAAAVLYAIAGIALAGILRNPGVNIASAYLLGPIAAVVIGGASLTGGLASPLSTFAAAIFLAGLNQMMRALGLPTSLQFVVFGLVIIGGSGFGRSDHQRRGAGAASGEARRPKARETTNSIEETG